MVESSSKKTTKRKTIIFVMRCWFFWKLMIIMLLKFTSIKKNLIVFSLRIIAWKNISYQISSLKIRNQIRFINSCNRFIIKTYKSILTKIRWSFLSHNHSIKDIKRTLLQNKKIIFNIIIFSNLIIFLTII